ncbi:MAG: hypothetical protein EA381_07615 [Planctomycetaceae bacterium]|nr:MAG: hypothetical protein EA381_07615 [Planctomycetaceae bacterium]
MGFNVGVERSAVRVKVGACGAYPEGIQAISRRSNAANTAGIGNTHHPSGLVQPKRRLVAQPVLQANAQQQQQPLDRHTQQQPFLVRRPAEQVEDQELGPKEGQHHRGEEPAATLRNQVRIAVGVAGDRCQQHRDPLPRRSLGNAR